MFCVADADPNGVGNDVSHKVIDTVCNSVTNAEPHAFRNQHRVTDADVEQNGIPVADEDPNTVAHPHGQLLTDGVAVVHTNPIANSHCVTFTDAVSVFDAVAVTNSLRDALADGIPVVNAHAVNIADVQRVPDRVPVVNADAVADTDIK